MANKVREITIRGKTMYAKILGDPIPTYDARQGKGDGREWKMDLELTPVLQKELKSYGIGDRIKQKEDYLDGAPYITLKQAEKQKAIDPETGKNKLNRPIRVVNAHGQAWDGETLIGNGSVVDVKIAIVDNGPGMKDGVYIRAVRVLKLVPYAGADFEPLSEDDEFFAQGSSVEEDIPQMPINPPAKKGRDKTRIDDDLDDEVPF